MKKYRPQEILLTALFLLGNQVFGWSQDSVPEVTPPTKGEIQQAIDITKQHIESRAKRIEQVKFDLKSLNARVEGAVDQIMNMLEPVKDSEQSHYQVTMKKQKAIEALKESIKDYDQLRKSLRKETRERDPKIARDEIYEDIEVLDDKVNKRVEQIISLSNSMETWNDLDKYNLRYSDGWSGTYSYRDRNPRYQQNKSQSRKTAMEREKLIADINDHLKRLEAENLKLKEMIDNPQITEQYREMLQYEYSRNTELMELRRSQQISLATSTKPETEAIGLREMTTIEGLIADIADDLKKDYDAFFRTYTELNQERQALEILKERLKTYLKMLEEA